MILILTLGLFPESVSVSLSDALICCQTENLKVGLKEDALTGDARSVHNDDTRHISSWPSDICV